MISLQVLCIVKGSSNSVHNHITHIGGNYNGGYWRYTQQEAITHIENLNCEFYVIAQGVKVNLIVATREGHKYLKTKNDGDIPNNLLSLRQCQN